MSEADTIRRLRAELDTANETIRQLREGTEPDAALPEWLPYLTPQQEKVFRILADGRRWPREKIMDRLYSHRIAAPEEKIVDVVICRLRHRLAAVGITIETAFGRGWRLTPDSVALLRADQPSGPAIDSHHAGVQHGAEAAAA